MHWIREIIAKHSTFSKKYYCNKDKEGNTVKIKLVQRLVGYDKEMSWARFFQCLFGRRNSQMEFGIGKWRTALAAGHKVHRSTNLIEFSCWWLHDFSYILSKLGSRIFTRDVGCYIMLYQRKGKRHWRIPNRSLDYTWMALKKEGIIDDMSFTCHMFKKVGLGPLFVLHGNGQTLLYGWTLTCQICPTGCVCEPVDQILQSTVVLFIAGSNGTSAGCRCGTMWQCDMHLVRSFIKRFFPVVGTLSYTCNRQSAWHRWRDA